MNSKIYSNGTPFSDKQWRQWYEGKIENVSEPMTDAERDLEEVAMKNSKELKYK